METRRLIGHDLDRLPKADERADPRRQRRALTEGELKRLLAMATARPLTDARMVRRGKRKGEAIAELREETVARLQAVGREKALIYKTLVLTGLRMNELRTLTVGQLDLTPGNSYLQLDAADEKSRQGNAVAIRDDLAADLRGWLDERLVRLQARAENAGEPIPLRVPGKIPVFIVPAGLLRILDRDLRAAGIPKRDDRGRTVDVHAMRTTFGTLLSKTGTQPRTAQAAMRHSDIKLTMGVYTDPRLLDVRGAVERLPELPLPADSIPTDAGVVRATGTDGGLQLRKDLVAPAVAPTRCDSGQLGSFAADVGSPNELQNEVQVGAGNACFVNQKPPLTTPVISGGIVGPAGFEPTTSCTPSKRASQAALRPDQSTQAL